MSRVDVDLEERERRVWREESGARGRGRGSGRGGRRRGSHDEEGVNRFWSWMGRRVYLGGARRGEKVERRGDGVKWTRSWSLVLQWGEQRRVAPDKPSGEHAWTVAYQQ